LANRQVCTATLFSVDFKARLAYGTLIQNPNGDKEVNMRKVGVSFFVIALVVSTLMYFRGRATAQSSGTDVLVVLSCAGPAPMFGTAQFASTGYGSATDGFLACFDTRRADPKMITTTADVVGGWTVTLGLGDGTNRNGCNFSQVTVPAHLTCELAGPPNHAVEFTIR
jgi:hypothetical protein